ncbi:MAG: hypothetical protein JNL01_12025 [Bdellovibrionales bacterium]|nr:hypothetical protein [Bdellovibrionales bacterium]
MESRYGNAKASRNRSQGKSAGVPVTYLKMVTEVFTNNFSSGLKRLDQVKKGSKFVACGEIFHNEIVLSMSITHPNELAATTAFASIDFDPKASSPKAEECLSACVDALGGVMQHLLIQSSDQQIEALAEESLAALEEVPFEWTLLEIERFKVYIKLDKSNPELDNMADDWLKKNDPNLKQWEDEQEEETKALFVTGPKKETAEEDDAPKKKKKKPGLLH